MSPQERPAALRRMAGSIERREDEPVEITVAERGSARSFAETVQVSGAIAHLRDTVEGMDRFAWEEPTKAHVDHGIGQGMVVREAYGVAL